LSDSTVLGLLAAPGQTYDLAKELAEELPGLLGKRLPDTAWEVRVEREDQAGAPDRGVDLLKVGRRRMLDEGWDLAICLTDLPLHVGRRPVTAHASVSLGVGVVSVPALGAVSVEERARRAVLRLVERLVTGDVTPGGATLDALTSPIGRVRPKEGGVRFVAAPLPGTLRLLVGMVRTNRPWRLVAGLSRALVAALGTAAVSLASTGVWHIADGMGWARLLGLLLLSVLVTSVSLVLVHDLWERPREGSSVKRTLMINLATGLTIAIGVLTLYLALFLVTTTAGLILIPTSVLEDQIGHHVDFGEYLKLAWLVSSLATVGGGLGSALEHERAVREAAYGYRPDEDEAGDGFDDGD
jgi:hypothetical protein